MVAPIFLSIVSPGIRLILTRVLDAAFTNKSTDISQYFIRSTRKKDLEELVKETKRVFDKREGKGPDLKLLKDLAGTLAEAETYGDIINYIFNHKLYCDLENIKIELDKLVEKLRGLRDKLPKNQSSDHEQEGEISLGNVRRCVLYLSCFPKGFVYNHKRITRLFVALGFIPAGSSKPLLQELAKVAKSICEGEMDPCYIPIGNDVEKETQAWPQRFYFREIVVEGIDSIKDQIFIPSLIVFGGKSQTFKLKEREFILLRILSLRNVRLEKKICLKKLSLLKHLDLKYTNVEDCSWLEALEELQMLDLRYTGVKKIPHNCLKKLGKLQHLLLGYRLNEGVSRLAGAIVNTEELVSKNLETLRSIRRPDQIAGSVDKVIDLSVTGLDPKRLQNFWDAVGKFKNLTSLGVSVTEGTVITLEDCPDNLKKKLERLRMEGQIFSTSSQAQSGLAKLSLTENTVKTLEDRPDNPKNKSERLRMKGQKSSTSSQPQSGLAKLSEFKLLIDLTLASDEPIMYSIPTLTTLLCLRLYGSPKETSCEINLKGFEKLKKVVIGDMKNVEKIHICSEVIGTVTTLKLCNLPNFSELLCLDTTYHLLRRNLESKTKGFKNIQSDKTIFLKGVDCKQFHGSPCLKIYHYDMDKQCYKEFNLIEPHGNQS